MTAGHISTREKIAIVASVALVLASIVYWAVQIKDMIATLRLANG